jgi:hypothetical protein
MEDFRVLHNNTVPKKHDSQNNTPLNITPLTHVSDGLYIECPPRGQESTIIKYQIITKNFIQLAYN